MAGRPEPHRCSWLLPVSSERATCRPNKALPHSSLRPGKNFCNPLSKFGPPKGEGFPELLPSSLPLSLTMQAAEGCCRPSPHSGSFSWVGQAKEKKEVGWQRRDTDSRSLERTMNCSLTCQANLVPLGTPLSGCASITFPSSTTKPVVRTSETNLPTCLGGKFVTQRTCLPTRSSLRYSLVSCALDLLIPISSSLSRACRPVFSRLETPPP